jgi:hypothetical protein
MNNANLTPMEEFAHDARHWARQSIIFTLQYGIFGANTPTEVQGQLSNVSDGSVEIIDQLWAKAQTESTGLTQTLRKFVWLVLEWSSEHLPRTHDQRHEPDWVQETPENLVEYYI